MVYMQKTVDNPMQQRQISILHKLVELCTLELYATKNIGRIADNRILASSPNSTFWQAKEGGLVSNIASVTCPVSTMARCEN